MNDTKDLPPLLGMAVLMKQAVDGIDLAPLATQLLARVKANPKDAHAWMDLSMILQLRFNPEPALADQALALDIQQLYRMPACDPVRIRLLALMAPGSLMANTPLEFLLAGSDVSLDMLYVWPGRPFPLVLPPHDLLFVAVGESDQNQALLEDLKDRLRGWPCPVVNPPDRILAMSRETAWLHLQSAPGLVMPPTTRLAREVLEAPGDGDLAIATLLQDYTFPIIIRPVDSHAGRGLAKIDSPGALRDYLQGTEAGAFYVSPFVDYRGPDGQFRKYRIVLIAGRPFAGHLGISEHWMIHYVNAGMAQSAQKRSEEARFMAQFDQDFAVRHGQALRAIHDRFDTDYLVIDCGETSQGQLLIFEVDTGAVIHDMDPVEVFPYKPPQMHKVFAAFREMLARRIAAHSP